MPSRVTSASVGNAGGSAELTRILSSRQAKHSVADGRSAGSATPGSKPAGVFISPQKLLVLADDGEFDELRSVVIGRREGHVKTAEVDVAHGFHRVDELLARQVVAGTAQALHQHLGGDKALEAGERVFLLSRRSFDQLLIFLDDGCGKVPGKGHDLGDTHTASGLPGFMRQRAA